MAKPGRWSKVNYAGVKKGEIDLFRTHLDSQEEFANSSSGPGMGQRQRGLQEKEKDTVRDSPGLQPTAGCLSYLHILSKRPA